LTGYPLLLGANNYTEVIQRSLALISCDPSSSAVQPSNILDQAVSAQAVAVVFYSLLSTGCSVSNYNGPYLPIFTMESAKDALQLVATVNPVDAIHADISRAPVGSTNMSNGNSMGTFGAPNTNIAMIILYSITGLVTALFLAIIVTGAIRAHRNPERYGPRNVTGRPRQSRARGLAKAMLDTLPIIKVGERQDHPKPTDVEMVAHGPIELLPAASASSQSPGQAPRSKDNAGTVMEGKRPSVDVVGGVATAAASAQQRAPLTLDTQGCSICTDEFEIGQDQRVLPCDHRFHPACIDPWLLNVSGTCPLCRIDLRPKEERDEMEAEDGLAPPLNPAEEGQRSWRTSLHHRILLGSGLEDRLTALRELRRAQPARPRSDEHAPQDDEAETNVRRRLRNTLRVRTRRIGETEQQELTESSPPRNPQQPRANGSGPSQSA
jgi:hypothetical protein